MLYEFDLSSTGLTIIYPFLEAEAQNVSVQLTETAIAGGSWSANNFAICLFLTSNSPTYPLSRQNAIKVLSVEENDASRILTPSLHN